MYPDSIKYEIVGFKHYEVLAISSFEYLFNLYTLFTFKSSILISHYFF